MRGSAAWPLVRALVAVLVLAHCAAGDCTAANNSTCGHGVCEGYLLINGVCTSICGAGSYYDHRTAMCLPCAALPPSSCSLLCPAFFFAPAGPSANNTNNTNSSNNSNATNSTNTTNTTNNTGAAVCQPCWRSYGLNCKACTASACSECTPGHQLSGDGQSCVATSCNISNCAQCSGSSGCYLCEPGFVVSQSGNSCIPVRCSVGYCSLCSGTSCLACISGYKLTIRGCEPICHPRCTNCISPGVCAKCQNGYALDTATYSCYLNCSAAFDGHCVACQNLLFCTTCEQGYVPALNGAICQPVYTCSDPHCSSCSIASICKLCNTGFYLSMGKCVKDICFIPSCIQCASVKRCKTCAPDYVLASDNSLCVPACSQTISHCLACNGTNSCHICDIGYTLSSNRCVPVCNISGCALCLTSLTCLICDNGRLASQDFTSCEVVCKDPYCYTCNSSSSCQNCIAGYSLHHGKCTPNCRQGSAINQNGVCQQCKLSLNNCQTCAFDSSNTIACTLCTAGFYLSSGSCFSCQKALPNCRLCSSPSECAQCKRGYVLSNGACVVQNCKAKNCLLCKENSTTLCATCASGFVVDASFNCLVICKAGQKLRKGVCGCPVGCYLPQAMGSCTPCSDSNCLSCTVSTCSECVKGYYASGSSCLPCISNCAVCSDSSSCQTCQLPYVYSNGSCTTLCSGFSGGVSPSGSVFTCDPGCSICGMTPDGVKVCMTVLDGYSSVEGSIIKCDSSCETCNGNSASDCLSCFSGSSLNSGVCTNCTDPNAVSCSSTDVTFSLSCIRGFTALMDLSSSPTTSRCQICAGNCYRCDIGGPGTCDAGQCEIGYVQQPGNSNCTQCFGGCSTCDPSNLMNCLSCGPRRYTDPFTGQCAGCPAGCQNCNGSQVCTSCFPNFQMVGTLCQVSPIWPCVQLVNGACTACVEDFTVNSNGACEYSSNCSATASCTNCPYGYYLTNLTSNLQGICSPCPPIDHCLTCSSVKSSLCFLCLNGYYVTSLGTCVACSKGCTTCSTGDFCTQAANGYFLVTGADGTPSGFAGVCAAPCLTCDVNPNFCLSCAEGYSIKGSTCFSDKVAYLTITFNLAIIFDEDDSFDVAYGKVCNNIGYFRTTICNNLPKEVRDIDLSCRSNFNFISFSQGSLTVLSQVDVSRFPSPAEAASALLAANVLPGAEIISTSVSTPGDASSSSSEGTNLGLILGVSIPLGLLLLVIIGIIIYAKTSDAKEEADDSGKPIEYDTMEHPQQMRRQGRDISGKPMNDAEVEEGVDRL